VILRREEDDRAEATVFAENDERSDLSAWELALAWLARRDRRRSRDLPSGVRDVAAAFGKKYQTVAPYLAAGEAITREVLAAAGAAGPDGEPRHERLTRLPLSGLQRVARAAATGTTAAAERLLRELARCGDEEATALLVARARALRGTDEASAAGFQVNIRQPLASVAPRQAAAYLARLAPAVAVLCARRGTGRKRGFHAPRARGRPARGGGGAEGRVEDGGVTRQRHRASGHLVVQHEKRWNHRRGVVVQPVFETCDPARSTAPRRQPQSGCCGR
jgi:hypothetical protein